MNELVGKINKSNVLAVFTGPKLDDYLKSIEDEALNLVPDISSDKRRKQISSKAYEVAQQKIEIDALGKELVNEWKQKSLIVDKARKRARDFLDDLKIKIRQPLIDWEQTEAKRQETEKLAKELEEAQIEAIQENELFDRQKEIERKEAQIEARENARIEAERIKKAKIEQDEREKRIAGNAKKQAELEAKEKIESEKRARIEAEIKAKQDAIEAEKKASDERQAAVQREKDAAEERERSRIEKERIAKEKMERKATNIQHQKKINNEALKCFISEGILEKDAKNIIFLIASDKIKYISVNY